MVLNKVLVFFIVVSVQSCSALDWKVSILADRDRSTSWQDGLSSVENIHICNNPNDSLILYVLKNKIGVRFISEGPPFLPVFPLKPNEYSTRLDVDLYFLINGKFSLDLERIKFINKSCEVYPEKIGEIVVDAGYNYRRYTNEPECGICTRKLKNTVVNKSVSSTEYKYYRFYFDILIDKVKDLEIHVDGLTINGIPVEVAPIYFKTKTRLKYWPIFIN